MKSFAIALASAVAVHADTREYVEGVGRNGAAG